MGIENCNIWWDGLKSKKKTKQKNKRQIRMCLHINPQTESCPKYSQFIYTSWGTIRPCTCMIKIYQRVISRFSFNKIFSRIDRQHKKGAGGIKFYLQYVASSLMAFTEAFSVLNFGLLTLYRFFPLLVVAC